MFKEQYENVCKNARTFPLSGVGDQFGNVKFDITDQRIGARHMKLIAIILLVRFDRVMVFEMLL